MPKFALRKLVRDRLPDVYTELGETMELTLLTGTKLWRALKQKFIEEAGELPDDTTDKKTLKNELGDLLRVLKDAATVAEIDFADIEAADAAKTAKKGGFLEGAYIETLETKDDDPWTEYYQQHPDRFPEIRHED